MTLDRRIEKLYPALSAAERVAMLLESRRQGAVDDPLVLSTMPPEQAKDLDRLLREVGIANHEIGMLILLLREATRALEWRWCWFESVVDHHNDIARLCKAPRKRTVFKALGPPVDLDAATDDKTLAGVAPVLLKGLRDSLVRVADGAYAAEQILEEFSEELGVDPLRPETRECLEVTMERVGQLLEQLDVWVGPIDAPGDVTEELTALRRVVECARARGSTSRPLFL